MMGLLLPVIVASLVGTVLWAVQSSLRPITQRVFSQAWHYYTGLVPVFFLLGGSVISNRLIQSMHNAGTPLLVVGQGPVSLPTVTIGAYVPVVTNLMRQESAIRFATLAWAVGAMVYLAVNVRHYWVFKRSVLKTSREWDAVPCPIRVIISPKARTPMLMGLWRPTLVLTDTPFAEEELAMIISHELVHFRRGDLLVKLMVLLANAVHWFNPAVYVLNKQLNALCELSCDEKVVRHMDPDNRRFYAQTLLSMLEYGVLSQNVVFTSGLCSSVGEMKRRLLNVMKVKPTKKSVLTLSLVVTAAVIGLGGLAAYAAQSVAPKEKIALPDRTRQEIEELVQRYEAAGVPVPEPYLDALENGVDSLAPDHMMWGGKGVTVQDLGTGEVWTYDDEGNLSPGEIPKGSPAPELTYEQVLERIRMHEEKGLAVPAAYLDRVRQGE